MWLGPVQQGPPFRVVLRIISFKILGAGSNLRLYFYTCITSVLFQIISVCHEAALFALQEDITTQLVQKHHFEQALSVVTPRTSENLKQFYTNYHFSSELHTA